MQGYSTRMSSTTNWESQLSPQEARAYAIFFAAANGGKPNVVTGQEAVTFFARSGIPNEILSDVSLCKRGGVIGQEDTIT